MPGPQRIEKDNIFAAHASTVDEYLTKNTVGKRGYIELGTNKINYHVQGKTIFISSPIDLARMDPDYVLDFIIDQVANPESHQVHEEENDDEVSQIEITKENQERINVDRDEDEDDAYKPKVAEGAAQGGILDTRGYNILAPLLIQGSSGPHIVTSYIQDGMSPVLFDSKADSSLPKDTSNRLANDRIFKSVDYVGLGTQSYFDNDTSALHAIAIYQQLSTSILQDENFDKASLLAGLAGSTVLNTGAEQLKQKPSFASFLRKAYVETFFLTTAENKDRQISVLDTPPKGTLNKVWHYGARAIQFFPKLFVELPIKALSEICNYGINRLQLLTPTSGAGQFFRSLALGGLKLVRGVFDAARFVVRSVIDPISNYNEAKQIHPALGYLSATLSVAAYTALAFFATPLSVGVASGLTTAGVTGAQAGTLTVTATAAAFTAPTVAGLGYLVKKISDPVAASAKFAQEKAQEELDEAGITPENSELGREQEHDDDREQGYSSDNSQSQSKGSVVESVSEVQHMANTGKQEETDESLFFGPAITDTAAKQSDNTQKDPDVSPYVTPAPKVGAYTPPPSVSTSAQTTPQVDPKIAPFITPAIRTSSFGKMMAPDSGLNNLPKDIQQNKTEIHDDGTDASRIAAGIEQLKGSELYQEVEKFKQTRKDGLKPLPGIRAPSESSESESDDEGFTPEDPDQTDGLTGNEALNTSGFGSTK